MTMKNLVYARVIGASHIKEAIPCQDFGGVRSFDSCQVFATADGHGDERCSRSDIGSEKVVDVALTLLEIFHKEMSEEGLIEGFLTNSEEFKERVQHLMLSIVSNWRDEVGKHYLQNPLTEKEIELNQSRLAEFEKGQRIGRLYGTTLIAGLLTDDYLLLLQQGDGRCVVFDEKGEATQPIPWDEKCFLNQTTSMCDKDVLDRFRYHIIPSPQSIVACFASSDGVEDSFATLTLMESYFRKQLIRAHEIGTEKLQQEWEEILPELSETGSRDDITITGFIDTDSLESLIPIFEDTNLVVQLQSDLVDIQSRIDSMEGMGRLSHLENDKSKLESSLCVLEEEYKELSTEIDNLSQADLNEINNNNSLIRLVNSVLNSTRSLQEIHDLCEQKIVAKNSEKLELELKISELKLQIASIDAQINEYHERRNLYLFEKEEILKKIEELKDTIHSITESSSKVLES